MCGRPPSALRPATQLVPWPRWLLTTWQRASWCTWYWALCWEWWYWLLSSVLLCVHGDISSNLDALSVCTEFTHFQLSFPLNNIPPVCLCISSQLLFVILILRSVIMGVDHGGQGVQVPPRIWSGGGTLMQIVPPDFVIYVQKWAFCGLENTPKSVFGRGSVPDPTTLPQTP